MGAVTLRCLAVLLYPFRRIRRRPSPSEDRSRRRAMYHEYVEWTAMATPSRPHPQASTAPGSRERTFQALSTSLVQHVPRREVAAYVEAIGDAVQCGWLNEVAEGYRLLDFALAEAECIPDLPGRRDLVRGYRRAFVLYVEQFWPRDRNIEVVDPADLGPSGI